MDDIAIQVAAVQRELQALKSFRQNSSTSTLQSQVMGLTYQLTNTTARTVVLTVAFTVPDVPVLFAQGYYGGSLDLQGIPYVREPNSSDDLTCTWVFPYQVSSTSNDYINANLLSFTQPAGAVWSLR